MSGSCAVDCNLECNHYVCYVACYLILLQSMLSCAWQRKEGSEEMHMLAYSGERGRVPEFFIVRGLIFILHFQLPVFIPF